MLTSNEKGAIAEAEIATAAIHLGLPVLRPVSEHGRYDLAFEVAGRLLRVQCKWGSYDPVGGVVRVSLTSNRCTPNGYERRQYEAGEIDLVAVYCGALDRCYLLQQERVVDRRSLWLRVSSPKNAQRACVNLASSFEFPGAVAQLEERLAGSQQVRGSSPLSSISPPTLADARRVGSNEFRNRFGFYLELAASGEEVHISRHGRPFARLCPAAPPKDERCAA